MNSWQSVRQVKHLLQQVEWTTDVPVFRSSGVTIASAVEDDFWEAHGSPLAVITPLGLDADAQEPNLLVQNIGLRVVVVNAHDVIGNAALIGSNRTSQTDSRGRGLLEVEEKVFDALAFADRQDGYRIQIAMGSAGKAEIRGSRYLVARDYRLSAYVTADRSYAPVRKASGSVSGSTVTLSWTLPGTRFDTRQIVIRRASGATAPSTSSDGTGVTVASNLPTSQTDAPGSGTWSYAIFVAYDEYGSSTNERFSAAANVTSVVVA